MNKEQHKPIIQKKTKTIRCDRCGQGLNEVPSETSAPLWATYACGCGKWVQYGAWYGEDNLWEYRPKPTL